MIEKSWRIPSFRKSKADLIETAEFAIEFTETAFPGVSCVHSGEISLAFAQLPITATKQQIVEAIETFIGPAHMAELEQLYHDRLAFEFSRMTDELVVFEPITGSLEISDRQFFQILANRELITKEEALAAVTIGTLPAAFETFVSSLPEAEEFNARMLLQGATTFRRDNMLASAFGAHIGFTEDQIDQLWRDGAQL